MAQNPILMLNGSPLLQPVEIWDGVEVHYKDSLALNTIVYDAPKDYIYVSFATMERLRRNPAMKEEAKAQAKRGGVRTIPEVNPIPGHHVGTLLKRSMSALNHYAHGLGDDAEVLSLRDEIVELRALLDESEAVLDTCFIVEKINRTA
jgi:hypothetical protein